MLMLIRNLRGEEQEAILLSAGPNVLRVAIPESADAVEFVRVGGLWFGEEDEPVLIEFEDEVWFEQDMASDWPYGEFGATVN